MLQIGVHDVERWLWPFRGTFSGLPGCAFSNITFFFSTFQHLQLPFQVQDFIFKVNLDKSNSRWSSLEPNSNRQAFVIDKKNYLPAKYAENFLKCFWRKLTTVCSRNIRSSQEMSLVLGIIIYFKISRLIFRPAALLLRNNDIWCLINGPDVLGRCLLLKGRPSAGHWESWDHRLWTPSDKWGRVRALFCRDLSDSSWGLRSIWPAFRTWHPAINSSRLASGWHEY